MENRVKSIKSATLPLPWLEFRGGGRDKKGNNRGVSTRFRKGIAGEVWRPRCGIHGIVEEGGVWR